VKEANSESTEILKQDETNQLKLVTDDEVQSKVDLFTGTLQLLSGLLPNVRNI